MLRHCVGFSNSLMPRNKTKTWIAQSISFSIFIFPSFSLPSPPQSLTPLNLGQLCLLIWHTPCPRDSHCVLADSGMWALGCYVWGKQLEEPPAEGAQSQATHYWAVAPTFETIVHRETKQNWSHQAFQCKCLKSAPPWNMLAPKRQCRDPGFYCHLILYFPFTVMSIPVKERCTGNEFYLQSPRSRNSLHHWPAVYPSACLLPSIALRSSSIWKYSLAMI